MPTLSDEDMRLAVEAASAFPSKQAAADSLNIAVSTFKDRLKMAARRGVAAGHLDCGVMPGYELGKVTFHRRADGSLIEYWDRQSPEVAAAQIISDAIAAFERDPIKLPLTAVPKNVNNDIIPWLQIGDGHIGMLAHEDEVGANFDIKIGKREICAAAAALIDECPKTERMVIQDLGDLTHYENLQATTEASGHRLDADSRYPKMIDAYIEIMLFIVQRALTRAQHVDVICNQGNHSRKNDMWMARLLRVAYKDNPRVHVLNNDNVFIGYRMGSTFVLCHHSDKCKPAQLAHVMATDFHADWGEATFRYIDIGHIHHNMVLKEHPGVTIESWNQLANKDAYAHDAGYRARQAMSMVYRSRTYGEKGRRRIPVEEVRDLIRANPSTADHYTPPAKRAYAV